MLSFLQVFSKGLRWVWHMLRILLYACSEGSARVGTFSGLCPFNDRFPVRAPPALAQFQDFVFLQPPDGPHKGAPSNPERLLLDAE